MGQIRRGRTALAVTLTRPKTCYFCMKDLPDGSTVRVVDDRIFCSLRCVDRAIEREEAALAGFGGSTK